MTCKALVTCILLSVSQSPWKSEVIATEICKSPIDKVLILAVFDHESDLKQITRPNATWDWGIAQLHCPPDTDNYVCTRCDIRNLRCNIRGGLYMLNQKKERCRRKPSSRTCIPHWIQAYNPRSPGYALRVLENYYKFLYLAARCEIDM